MDTSDPFLMFWMSFRIEKVSFTTTGSRTLSANIRMEENLVLEGNVSLIHWVFFTNSLSFGCQSFKPSFSSSSTMNPVLAAAVMITVPMMKAAG